MYVYGNNCIIWNWKLISILNQGNNSFDLAILMLIRIKLIGLSVVSYKIIILWKQLDDHRIEININ